MSLKIKMRIKRIIDNAFSDQRSTTKYNKEDNVCLFGLTAGVMSVVSGAFLFLFLKAMLITRNMVYLQFIGIAWIIFGILNIIGVLMFEESKIKSGKFLITVGVLGFVMGAGFFLGAILTIIAGVFALKYAKKK